MENSLAELFREYAGVPCERMEMLAVSGSNRKYYRIYAPESVAGAGIPRTVIGVAGTDAEENRIFCALAAHLAEKGINVPAVYRVGPGGMCYLQQDLGDVSLFDAVAKGRAEATASFALAGSSEAAKNAPEACGSGGKAGAYSGEERRLLIETVSMLPDIQFKGAEGFDFSLCYPCREMNARNIMFDLNYFKYCFLKISGKEFNAERLEDDFEKLCDDVLGIKERAFMYRDFQARNVMLCDGKPYFIDFQGGYLGPVHYDAAAFIWQARSCYPADLREEMVAAYLKSLKKYVAEDDEAFRKNLMTCLLFRTLQVLGAYGFRGLTEKKQYFIDSIPFAMANVRELIPYFSGTYPYLCGLLGELAGDYSGTKKTEAGLEMEICSFSYRKGLPHDGSGNGGGYLFDCRGLHNPGRYPQYRNSTGRDADVIEFFAGEKDVPEFLEHVYGIVDPHAETYLRRGFTHLSVGFGCTGGQHRSVYCAEHLVSHLRERFAGNLADGSMRIILTHREQGITEKF